MTKEEIKTWFIDRRGTLNFSDAARQIGMKPQNFYNAIYDKAHPVTGKLLNPLNDKYVPVLEDFINRLTTI